MSGGGAGGHVRVEVLDAAALGGTGAAGVRVGIIGGRVVLVVRELVQCALNVVGRNASRALEGESSKELAGALGLAGAELGMALWPGSSKSVATCDARHAGAVMTWAEAHEQTGHSKALSSDDRARLIIAIDARCRELARERIQNLRVPMVASLGLNVAELDPEVGQVQQQLRDAERDGAATIVRQDQQMETLRTQFNTATAQLQQLGQERDEQQRRALVAENSLVERMAQRDAALVELQQLGQERDEQKRRGRPLESKRLRYPTSCTKTARSETRLGRCRSRIGPMPLSRKRSNPGSVQCSA